MCGNGFGVASIDEHIGSGGQVNALRNELLGREEKNPNKLPSDFANQGNPLGLSLARLRSYAEGMEQLPPAPPEPPSALTARVAKLITEFTERQKPSTQAAIAKALGVVNDLLSRLQKKKSPQAAVDFWTPSSVKTLDPASQASLGVRSCSERTPYPAIGDLVSDFPAVGPPAGLS